MKKRAILMVCAAAIALALVLSGCGPAAKKTGSLTVSVTVPPGPSAYPQVPNPWRDKVRTGRGSGREIPQGTEFIDVTIYNTFTLWSHTATIVVTDPGVPQTVTIDAIPVGSGYTVEVFPYDANYWSLVAGKATGLTIAEGAPTTVNLTLTRPSFSLTSMPASVGWGDPFTVAGNMTLPVDITAYTGVAFVDDLINWQEANIIGVDSAENYSFLAGIPTAVTMSDFYYLSISGDPAPGTYYLLAAAAMYEQPVSGNYYVLAWMPPSNITMEVLAGGSATGSMEVIIQ